MGSIVYNGVLLSAGIGELILFLVAGTVLCFGFSMRIMLVTHWYFGCCWAVLTLNPGIFSFPRSGSEQVHKKLGGSTARTGDPNLPKGCSMPWSIMVSVHTGEVGQELLIACQGWAGHWSEHDEQLYWVSPLFCGFNSSLFLSPFPLLLIIDIWFCFND